MANRNRTPLFALLAAEAISRTGSALTSIAIPWFVLQTTGSPAKLGLTGGIESVAFVAAGFLAGPLVDRLGFKRFAIISDMASGLVVALIPFLYMTIGLPFWQLLALTGLASLFSAPNLAAHIGLVPPLAATAGMPIERANAASQSIANLARLVGPVAAGVLVAVLAASNVLWLDAGSFAASAILIAFLVSLPSEVESKVALDVISDNVIAPGDQERYVARIMEGLRHIWHDGVIIRVVMESIVINFVYVPVLSVVLVVYAQRVLQGSVDLGLMFGGFGAGGLAGSVLYGIAGPRLPRRPTLAAANAALSLATWALVVTPPLAATVASLILAGIALSPGNPIIYTVTQERTPDTLLGRVVGTQLALSNAVTPLGIMLAGFLLDITGLRPILIAVAAVILAVATYVALNPTLAGMDER